MQIESNHWRYKKPKWKIGGWTLPLVQAFQINRDPSKQTVEPPANLTSSDPTAGSRAKLVGRFVQVCDVILIFLALALFAGQLPPGVNESHYLTKAKHFWNPDWCPGDIFLSSTFSHWLFYAGFGWLTNFFSLPTFAWLGRCFTWLLLAFSWQRLCWELLPRKPLGIFSVILFLIVNDRFHLAGEWVVGGFEAKGLAYGFVLLALAEIARSNWKRCWIFLGIASASHVLVGGWATLAAIFSWTLSIRQTRAEVQTTFRDLVRRRLEQIPFLIGGGVIALVGIVPPLVAEVGVASETRTLAHSIYVNHRIAHHLNFSSFPTINVARFTVTIVAWYLMIQLLKRRSYSDYRMLRPFSLFCAGSLLISLAGLTISGLAEQSTGLESSWPSLLRFYWFRLSDFALPFALALTGGLVITKWLLNGPNILSRIIGWLVALCILGSFTVLVLERYEIPRPAADIRSLPDYQGDEERTMATYRNWIKVCTWIRENTPTDSVFITPNEQQTFKWYAQRTEVVAWKDIPQDPESIQKWQLRLQQLYEPQRRYEAGLMSYDDQQLLELGRSVGANYILIPQRHVDLVSVPTKLRQVYPEQADARSAYVVFELD